jgi:hypothetical protein
MPLNTIKETIKTKITKKTKQKHALQNHTSNNKQQNTHPKDKYPTS